LAPRIERLLFERVDAAPLVVWRIAFGVLMIAECVGSMLSGWVKHAFVEPRWHFTYTGFDWVRPIPGFSPYLHHALMAAAALGVALGWRYHASATLLAIGWAYAFLLEKAFYQNHYYLILLVAALMALAPAAHAGSLDARRHPELARGDVPAWPIASLRMLLTIVYFYAGVAKLDPEWLGLRALAQWLPAKAHLPVVGPLYASRATAAFMAWGGLLFDLTLGVWLWWPRTRRWAALAAMLFHAINAVTFEIGIFPLLGAALTALFLPPSWFRALLGDRLPPFTPEHRETRRPGELPRRAMAPLLGAFFALQILIPLRHFLIPGDVTWTEEGHRFSWRMKLRNKQGTATCWATDPSNGERFAVRPEDWLVNRQLTKLPAHPDMVRQFARKVADDYAARGRPGLEIRCDVRLSLNGRPPRPLVDPDADLARVQERWLAHDPWILDGPSD
jgi:hypothetical protein